LKVESLGFGVREGKLALFGESVGFGGVRVDRIEEIGLFHGNGGGLSVPTIPFEERCSPRQKSRLERLKAKADPLLT